MKKLFLALSLLALTLTPIFAQDAERTEEYAILEFEQFDFRSTLSLTDNAKGTRILERYRVGLLQERKKETEAEILLEVMNELNARGFKLKSTSTVGDLFDYRRTFVFTKTRPYSDDSIKKE